MDDILYVINERNIEAYKGVIPKEYFRELI
jgi:hypothetical protein